MKQDFLENEYVELWIEEGIIFEIFKSNLNYISLDVAKQIVIDRLKISRGITMPIFIELNKTMAAEKKAREYLAGEESIQFLNAAAILIENPLTLMVARLFLVLNRPRLKTELFSNREKALEWLNKFKR